MSVLPFGGWGAGPTRLSWECASGPGRVRSCSGVRAPVRCCRTGRGFCSLPVVLRCEVCERAGLLSEVGDRVAEDLLEGDPLGPQLVHPAPDGGAAEDAGPDVVGEPADEVQLGAE